MAKIARARARQIAAGYEDRNDADHLRIDPALRFATGEDRNMGGLAYNLLHILRQFYVMGEGVRRSVEWLIKRFIKAGARVSYHTKRWHVHVASAFPLSHYLRAVLGYG
jgi:hypothetical protein